MVSPGEIDPGELHGMFVRCHITSILSIATRTVPFLG
jgi:hypothetical protein